MAGREDGGTVFIAHADDLRLEVGMQAQLVADGCGQHIARRHLALLLVVGTDDVDRRVVGAVDLTAVFEEVVAADAVERRRGAGIDGRVAYRRYRRDIVDQAVVAGKALTYQPPEAVVGKLVVVTRQVVPAHLVYDDAYY